MAFVPEPLQCWDSPDSSCDDKAQSRSPIATAEFPDSMPPRKKQKTSKRKQVQTKPEETTSLTVIRRGTPPTRRKSKQLTRRAGNQQPRLEQKPAEGPEGPPSSNLRSRNKAPVFPADNSRFDKPVKPKPRRKPEPRRKPGAAEKASKAQPPVIQAQATTTRPSPVNPIELWADQVPEAGAPEVTSVTQITQSSAVRVSPYPYYRYEHAWDMNPTSSTTASATSINETEKPKRTKKRTQVTELKAVQALEDRNVDVQASETNGSNKSIEQILDSLSKGHINKKLAKLSTNAKKEEEQRWKRDMLHCERENEAVFQRTIMMTIINRDEFGEQLYYTCEKQWDCEPMPQRKSSEVLPLSSPKPDLCIGFRTRELMDRMELVTLNVLAPYMFPVPGTENGKNCIFYFFSLEAKGLSGDDLRTTLAHRQTLNTASQALYNMYIVMKEAKLEDSFFEAVLFFSMIATPIGFHVRVHRAVPFRKAGLNTEDTDCLLWFEFYEIYQNRTTYSLHEASEVVRIVLHDYGVKVLLPIMKDAVRRLLRNPPKTVSATLLNNITKGGNSSQKRSAPEDAANQSFTSQIRKGMDGVRLPAEAQTTLVTAE